MACQSVGSPQSSRNERSSTSHSGGWKRERVSESELYGTVNYDLETLLMRGDSGPQVMGLSRRAVHGDRKACRSYEQNAVSLERSHLGTGTCDRSLRAMDLPRPGGANWLEVPKSQPVCDRPQRRVDQANARSNVRDTGEVPGCIPAELNSTMPRM